MQCGKHLKYPPGGICRQNLNRGETCPDKDKHRSLDNTNKGKGYGKQDDTKEAHGIRAKGSWSRGSK